MGIAFVIIASTSVEVLKFTQQFESQGEGSGY